MTVYAYLRVSTDQQDVDNQRYGLLAFNKCFQAPPAESYKHPVDCFFLIFSCIYILLLHNFSLTFPLCCFDQILC